MQLVPSGMNKKANLNSL